MNALLERASAWVGRVRSGAGVHARAVRAALAATGVVALLYTGIAVVVVVIVSQSLTSQIDRRLSLGLTSLLQRAEVTGEIPPLRNAQDPGGGRFGTPLLIWIVDPAGNVTANYTGATLPDAYRHATGPAPLSLGGERLRVVGGQAGPFWIVMGQSMTAVDQAQSTVILAEAVVAPFLLGLVFLGAFTVGRRVAAPIEESRQRQLRFTADASHELRTPLAVIEAEASLALQAPRDAASYQHSFARVDAESKRMRALVDDLLWLARLDASTGDPEREPVDVGVLAEGTVDRFATVARSRNLALAAVTRGGNPVVNASVDWLDRLLGVLVDNACRYTPGGGRVRVNVEANSGRVRLSVEDSGPGIPREERARVTNRFHRGSDAPGGSGLGLAIADAIARATGGNLDIGESTHLGGARISVAWPQVAVTGRVTLTQGTAS